MKYRKGDKIACLINPWADFNLNVPPGTIGTVTADGGDYFVSVRWATGVRSKTWLLAVGEGGDKKLTTELIARGKPAPIKRMKKATIRKSKGGGVEVELFPGVVWRY